jgi:uncharacterized protein (DUF305 family)
VPTGDMSSMESMGGSGSDMSGMMSQSDMDQLRKLSGTEFDTAFLQMVIQHHQGAVTAMPRAPGPTNPTNNQRKPTPEK